MVIEFLGDLIRRLAAALALAGCALLASPVAAQGPAKLVGAGSVGLPRQGTSVAISADGNTAIVGGPGDDSNGAAWVFTFSNGAWTQQGNKLVATDNIGNADQGFSVALSADGNTALIGGPADNQGIGAAWVFTRSNNTWTERAKLVGSGSGQAARQGYAVALSADGVTAIIGGESDAAGTAALYAFAFSNGSWTQQGSKLVPGDAVPNFNGWHIAAALSADGNTALMGVWNDQNFVGAAWVFTRSNGSWTQQGNKLIGSGGIEPPGEGYSVALSADGNTAVFGGPDDGVDAEHIVGAAWVFTRANGLWTPQQKLVATGFAGMPNQGTAVALSADGNTALVGGQGDNMQVGATWLFTRNNSTWTQLGSKLVGTGSIGQPQQGASGAMTADGDTFIVGGPQDQSTFGAAWVLSRPAVATHDFNGDRLSDIAWRNSDGTAAAWLMNGAQVLGAGNFGLVPSSWGIVGQRDFDGDGKYDWLWRDGTSNTVAIWLLNGISMQQAGSLGVVAANWGIFGTSDFNGDGKGDILWRDSQSGTVAVWLMNGLSVLQAGSLGALASNWVIQGTDGQGHILWRDNQSGAVMIWTVAGLEVTQTASLGVVSSNWVIIGSGDFNGDGATDILWRDSGSGTVAIWLLNASFQLVQSGTLGAVGASWQIALTGDFNGDGRSDILWRNTATGDVAIWFMNGLSLAAASVVANVPTAWTIQGANAE